jgi:ribosomal protein S8
VKNGKGIFIISSYLGLITDFEARFKNIGGEILFYIE